MTTETSPANKMQSVLWWITSIAVSVLCCSILFVLFASYLVDIKERVQDTQMRITMLEQRQNVLLSDLEQMRKPPATPASAPVAAAPASAPAETAPADSPPASVPGAAPVISPPVMSAPSVPANPTPAVR